MCSSCRDAPTMPAGLGKTLAPIGELSGVAADRFNGFWQD